MTEREPLNAGDLFAYLRAVVLRRPLRFAAMVAFVAAGFFAWSQSSAPVFRSTVKVRVEDVAAETPQLGHRGIPAGATTTDEALTALRSTTLIERIVRSKCEEEPLGLGLTTWVTDENASPLSKTLRRLTGRGTGSFRIQARAQRVRADAPRAVRLRFIDDDNVRLSIAKGRPGVEWPDEKLEEMRFVRGRTLYYHGFAIDLDVPDGPRDDRVWRIEVLEEDVAVDRVLSRTRVDKQQHQAGALAITVTDQDPVRATAIANGLAAAFVATDLERTQERALGRVAYVEEELEGRREALDRLYGERAELLVRYPDAVAADAVGTELAEREGAWDDAWRRAHGERVAAEEALARLRAGSRPRVALASLQGGIPAEIAPLLDALEAEETQLRQVGRGTLDLGYRRTLLLKSDDATVAAQAIDARVMDLAAVVHALERGDDAALARLAGAGSGDGSVQIDGSVQLRVDRIADATNQLNALLLEFKPSAPPVKELELSIEQQRQDLIAALHAQLGGIEAARRRKAEYADFWRDLYDRFPAEESRVIEESTAALELELGGAFASWLDGKRAEEERALEERDRLKARVRGIALAQRELERIAPELQQLEGVVGDLLRDRDNAEIAAAGIEPAARIVDPAREPRGRLKPRASFGLVAGLFLGLLVALAWATASSESRGSGRPLRRAGLPGGDLGEVGVLGKTGGAPRPIRRLRATGQTSEPLWAPALTDPSGVAALGFRRLRARVTAAPSANGIPARAIGVVGTAPRSTGAGHSASTVALNLALVRALGGERVALIDCDFVEPSIERALEHAGIGLTEPSAPDPLRLRLGQGGKIAARRPGLAQVLAGSAERGAAPTSLPGLDVLGPGESLASPPDLLASAHFADFIEELAGDYDAVIVALPCPDVGGEAEALARAIAGFVIVHPSSERGALDPLEVSALLAGAGGTVLGTVTAVETERRRAIQPVVGAA